MNSEHPVALRTEGFTVFWDGVSYVVRKPGDTASRELSYCSTIEGALKTVFRHMVIQRIAAARDHGATGEELKKVILEVRQRFADLVVMPEEMRRTAQRIGERAKTDPSAYERVGTGASGSALQRRTGDKRS